MSVSCRITSNVLPMKHIAVILCLIPILVSPELRAERNIVQIFLPVSLAGTELDADPLETGESMGAIILARPALIGGAYPEGLIAAICRPLQLGRGDNNFPDESNLLILIGAKISAEHGIQNEPHQITVDFTKINREQNSDSSISQALRLTAECLKRTIAQNKSSREFQIAWLVPVDFSIEGLGLPGKLQANGERVEADNPLPAE